MDRTLKIIVKILLIILLGSVGFAGCSLKPVKEIQVKETETTKDLDSDLIIVGFSQLGSESDWRTANTKSIQKALVKENGFSLIYSNGRQSQENQIKDIRSFIFQEVDYILLAPVVETGWDTVLTEAKEAGIPVIIVDRMIKTEDDSLYVAYVGTDKYEEGRKAGLWLEKYLYGQKEKRNTSLEEGIVTEEENRVEDKNENQNQNKDNENENKKVNEREATDVVNIVVLEGTPNSSAQIGRAKGFEDVAALHSNWKVLARENGDFTKAKGKEVMKKYLEELDDIDVLLSHNDDMTFGAIEAIHEAGLTCGVNGDIIVISFDAVAEAFDKMEAGLINVDIECNPLQGELIADIIGRIEKGETVEKVSYVEGKVFEAENATSDRIGRSY